MRVEQPYGERYKTESFSEEPKRRYFIACEGRKTEYKYFEGLIKYRLEIGIDPLVEIIPIKHEASTSSNPLQIYIGAREAIKNIDNYFKEDVLCIIADRDFHSFVDFQYDELLKAEKEDGIRLCISNPNFEFWLLLHFNDYKNIDKNLLLENRKQGKRTYTELLLKNELGGSYSKKSIKFESNYKSRIPVAIKNAMNYEVENIGLRNHIGTNVGLLIKEMLDK